MASEQAKREAAELLLSDAHREAEEALEHFEDAKERLAQAGSRVDWLTAYVQRFSDANAGEAASNRNGSSDGVIEIPRFRLEIANGSYGAMKRAVHSLMESEGKGLKAAEIAKLIMAARLKDDYQAAFYSARNALKALVKSNMVKKTGPGRYKAI